MLRTHKTFNGLSIVIENPAGTARMGRGHKDWRTLMHFHYGYIPNTQGADGDEIDVFFPSHKFWSTKVFVVHQKKRGEDEYDEDKVMVGFEDRRDAVKAYCMSYEDASLYLGPITEWEVDELVEVLKRSEGKPGRLDAEAKKNYLPDGFRVSKEKEEPGYGRAKKDLNLREKSSSLWVGLEVFQRYRR